MESSRCGEACPQDHGLELRHKLLRVLSYRLYREEFARSTKRYEEIYMNEQTDPDVLMHGVIAAVGPQALTEMETKRPESAPAASIGHNELFSVTELLAAAPMKFYLAARMQLIELRKMRPQRDEIHQ